MAITATPDHFADGATSSSNSHTIGSGAGWTTPTSGDILLVAVCVQHNSGNTLGTVTGPSGFTLLDSYTTYTSPTTNNAPAAFLYWKISDGTETSFTWSCTGASITRIGMHAYGWDPTDLGTDLSDVQVDINDTYFNTIGTTTDHGAITNDQPNALCLAIVHIENSSSNWFGPSWTNSFVEYQDVAWANAGMASAIEVVSTSASITSTCTASGAGTQTLGTLIVINEPVTAPTITAGPELRKKTDTTALVAATATEP